MFRIGCLALVILLIAVPAIAAQFLPWWGTLLVVIGEAFLLVIGGPKLIGFAIKRFATGMFMTKSKVLRGAQVHVHEVRPTEKPTADDSQPPELVDQASDDDDVDMEVDEEEDELDEPETSVVHRYVLVDFTLTPAKGASKMQFWDPSELMLVPFDAKVDMSEDPTDDDRSAAVHTVRLIDDAGNESYDFDKLTGKTRLRAVFACPPTLTGRAKFRYYFETFGDVLLPA